MPIQLSTEKRSYVFAFDQAQLVLHFFKLFFYENKEVAHSVPLTFSHI